MSRLTSRLNALGDLRGAREIVLFAQVSAFAAGVPLLMRLPLPRVDALLSHGESATVVARHQAPERLLALVNLTFEVFGPLVRPGCLTRGVTLFWFLRRGGMDVELCFGIDARHGLLDGHCWLLRDGQPFLEREDPRSRFAETYRLPATRGDDE